MARAQRVVLGAIAFGAVILSSLWLATDGGANGIPAAPAVAPEAAPAPAVMRDLEPATIPRQTLGPEDLAVRTPAETASPTGDDPYGVVVTVRASTIKEVSLSKIRFWACWVRFVCVLKGRPTTPALPVWLNSR